MPTKLFTVGCGELRTLLSARVKKAVAYEVAKDLTASSPTALRKALASTLTA